MNTLNLTGKPSAIPTHAGEMISHSIRQEGSYPRTVFISVFEYPDCTREFDGKNWKVINWKRPGLWSTVTGLQITSDLS